MIEDQLFANLMESSSHANRARLLSVAASHSSSWLSVVPSTSYAGTSSPMSTGWPYSGGRVLDTSGRSMCPFSPDTAHDPLGHHAETCRHGGDVVIHHT